MRDTVNSCDPLTYDFSLNKNYHTCNSFVNTRMQQLFYNWLILSQTTEWLQDLEHKYIYNESMKTIDLRTDDSDLMNNILINKDSNVECKINVEYKDLTETSREKNKLTVLTIQNKSDVITTKSLDAINKNIKVRGSFSTSPVLEIGIKKNSNRLGSGSKKNTSPHNNRKGWKRHDSFQYKEFKSSPNIYNEESENSLNGNCSDIDLFNSLDLSSIEKRLDDISQALSSNDTFPLSPTQKTYTKDIDYTQGSKIIYPQPHLEIKNSVVNSKEFDMRNDIVESDTNIVPSIENIDIDIKKGADKVIDSDFHLTLSSYHGNAIKRDQLENSMIVADTSITKEENILMKSPSQLKIPHDYGRSDLALSATTSCHSDQKSTSFLSDIDSVASYEINQISTAFDKEDIELNTDSILNEENLRIYNGFNQDIHIPLNNKSYIEENSNNFLVFVEKLFGDYKDLPGINFETFEEKVIVEYCQMSKYLTSPVFNRIIKNNNNFVLKEDVLQFLNNKIYPSDPNLTFLNLLRQENNQFLCHDDFVKPIEEILRRHPSIDFLKDLYEYQQQYIATVITRIFYMIDLADIGKIYLEDLYRFEKTQINRISELLSETGTYTNYFEELNLINLPNIWRSLDNAVDTNDERFFFSYEHFYVIYSIFWNLDENHDFYLSKQDLLRYNHHALSMKTINRIFSVFNKKSEVQLYGKSQVYLSFTEFIVFLINDEDKTTDRSLKFWFDILDLDSDGYIRYYEMKYFYDEQKERLESFNQEPVLVEDILCQMNDFLKPECYSQFTLNDIKRTKKSSGLFFDIFFNINLLLLSLTKFIDYEIRDPFQMKLELAQSPFFSNWDTFCQNEYVFFTNDAEEEEEEEEETI